MRKFVVCAPPYRDDVGGAICLHKLVHLLRQCGVEAYITTETPLASGKKFNLARSIFRKIKAKLRGEVELLTNPAFDTPILSRVGLNEFDDGWIVVYPEITFGNPLGAKNVVRWLLHQPGFHTGKISYGSGEFYVKFNGAIKDFSFPGSKTSALMLPIIHYPLETYFPPEAHNQRNGVAYCVRKGDKSKVNQGASDILIDGLTHKEIAEIFRKVETFVSYDAYTAYSRFASISGCDSVVIPEKGVTKDEWYPNPDDRLGVAYGFEEIESARKSREELMRKIQAEHKELNAIAMNFVLEANTFFDR